MNTADYNKLVRDFLKYLDSLSPEAISSVIYGNKKILFTLSDENPHERKTTAQDAANHTGLIDRLSKSKNRDEAHALLAELSKASLLLLAKTLDTPTQKADTIERLRDKIVESTIGFRMRSEAIQAPNAEQGAAGDRP
jgi:hypothetical protein